jgi:choline dehydrogenase-like flavoprotein
MTTGVDDPRQVRPQEICVVGSGPAAAAAAFRLASRGLPVTVIDAGLRIEPELAPLTRMPHPLDRDRFIAATTEARRRVVGRGGGLPPKLPFGSDFVYRGTAESRLDAATGVHVETSLAFGGLSNAWGANVCAVAQRDMADWPFAAEKLSPYFAALADVVEVAGAADAIDALYDAKLGGEASYELCGHARDILTAAACPSAAAAADGLHVGRAKIAVGRRHSVDGRGCVSCGLCMLGCPHGAIYNAADTMQGLVGRGQVRLLDRRVVLRFAEDEDGTTLETRPIDGGPTETRRFARVLIGCGVLGGTALVARSLGWQDRDFIIRDSLKYYFPYVRRRAVSGARHERTNTLAQVFIQDVGMKNAPDRTAHCQLYGVNELFFESLRGKFGALAPLAAPLAEWAGTPLWNRIMIGMVYFHSDQSGALRLRVAPRPEDGLGRLEAISGPDPAPLFAEFCTRLTAASKRLGGGRPLPFLAERSPPGHSMHFGGSLPMRADPGAGETDIWGRPFGCRRTHVIDTSVFPSIPGTPTTFPVMANAMRIADAAADMG